MESYTYLLLDLGALIIPLLFSFHPRIRFHEQWKAFWPACFAVAALFIAWDVAFTRMGVWGFNERYLLGVDLLGLPVEEWLFFICIPYACVFTYFVLGNWRKDPWFPVTARSILWSLAGIAFIMALLHTDRWYTLTTFFGLGITLLWLAWKNVTYWGRFLVTYALILVPFFLIDGVLTGSWIEGQVVWYNDAENLGIRMGTIPVEDAFYGMLLILLNVAGFEGLRERRAP